MKNSFVLVEWMTGLHLMEISSGLTDRAGLRQEYFMGQIIYEFSHC